MGKHQHLHFFKCAKTAKTAKTAKRINTDSRRTSRVAATKYFTRLMSNLCNFIDRSKIWFLSLPLWSFFGALAALPVTSANGRTTRIRIDEAGTRAVRWRSPGHFETISIGARDSLSGTRVGRKEQETEPIEAVPGVPDLWLFESVRWKGCALLASLPPSLLLPGMNYKMKSFSFDLLFVLWNLSKLEDSSPSPFSFMSLPFTLTTWLLQAVRRFPGPFDVSPVSSCFVPFFPALAVLFRPGWMSDRSGVQTGRVDKQGVGWSACRVKGWNAIQQEMP